MGGTGFKFFILFPIVTFCLLFLLQILWIAEATASFVKCPDVNVKVYTEIKEDIPFICNAAKSTFSFLRKAGLHKSVPIEVYIVNEMETLPIGNLYLGMYDRRLKRVTVLSYNSCKRYCKDACFCGLRLCRKLHSSFVVHEIAHAIAHANFIKNTQNIAAEEYIACTTQLALLPDDLRQKILTRINNKGFGHEREITSLFYDLNSSVFAVKAYRHFIRPENGKSFYHKLITGE